MSAPRMNRVVANFKATATRDKQSFPFDPISDPDEKLRKRFDVIREKTLK